MVFKQGTIMNIEYELMPNNLDQDKFILFFKKYHELMRDEMTSNMTWIKEIKDDQERQLQINKMKD